MSSQRWSRGADTAKIGAARSAINIQVIGRPVGGEEPSLHLDDEIPCRLSPTGVSRRWMPAVTLSLPRSDGWAHIATAGASRTSSVSFSRSQYQCCCKFPGGQSCLAGLWTGLALCVRRPRSLWAMRVATHHHYL